MDALRWREFTSYAMATALLGVVGRSGLAHADVLKQARIVLGFPAGSNGDALCRLFADKIKGRYAENVIVENKAGAAGRIGVDAVKAAPADGATLLFTPTSVLTLYPHIYKTLNYDPFNDFVPLSRAATVTFALAIGPKAPADIKTLPQFVEWCRANPSLANFGSPGAGSSPHFLGATFAKAANISLNHVAYRGTSAAVMDLIGGQIPAVVVSPGNVTQYAKSGQVRILAVTSPARWELLPDIPTMAELGYPKATYLEQFAFFMKRGADAEVIDHAASAIRAAAAMPDVIKTLAEVDMKVEASASAVLTQSLRAEYDHWRDIVKSVGFTPQD